MRFAARTQPITIEQQVDGSKDKFGVKAKVWVAFKSSVFAGITYRPGREYYDGAGNQRFSEATAVFDCAYFDVTGVDTTMRIDVDGQKYDIRAVRPDHASRENCLIDATLQNAKV